MQDSFQLDRGTLKVKRLKPNNYQIVGSKKSIWTNGYPKCDRMTGARVWFRNCKFNWQIYLIRRVWIYQRGNQNPYIEEEQTTEWPKEKGQRDKQRSTKHTYKTKDQVTRTALKTRYERRYYGRVSSSSSTSGTRRVNIVKTPVISHEWGKDREMFTTSGTYP
jgi:hypothetical protein